MDPAAAGGGVCVTSMSLSRAGRSSERTWAELPRALLNDHATTWSGPTRQSLARNSEPLHVSVAGALARARDLLFD